MADSNFEVDLDELRRAHIALGQVAEVNQQVEATLPRGGSPAAGPPVPSAQRAVAAYTALLERLVERQRRGVTAIGETRRRLAEAETAYREADRL